MNRREAEHILLALDGVVAGIETLREVVNRSIDEDQPESRTETARRILSAETQDDCDHPDMKIIETMAEKKSYCFDCGYSE